MAAKQNYQQLNNKLDLETIDRYGYSLDCRELRNSPLAELYPDKPVVQIQWTAKDDGGRPEPADLKTPVVCKSGAHAGLAFRGDFAWGSAVKRGETIGLAEDWVVSEGPVRMVEDGQRVQRWLLAAGIFGGFTAKTLRVGILPHGADCKAGPVRDGFGYINKDLIAKFGRKERVHLGVSRDNWTYWQRLKWQTIAAGVVPLIVDACTEASDPSKMLWASPHSYEQKKRLADLDRDMLEHPNVAASLNKMTQSYYARLCNSVNLNGLYRVAVPTFCPTICFPGHEGRMVVDRSPIDSNGNIQAVEVVRDKLYAKEEKRIAGMEVAQVSISTRDLQTKGCLGAVDKKLLGGFDLIICAEDVKMCSEKYGSVDAVRQLSEITLEDAVVPFLMIWDSESLVGVNDQWAKYLMGLDHDGDAIRVVLADDKPWLWEAVKELVEQGTPKLKKSKTRIEENDTRAEMIAKSMANLVGHATICVGNTFAAQDRLLIARQLGYKTVEAMDKRGNYFIKVGTDGFKTQEADMQEVEREVAIQMANLQTMFGALAPWSGWDGSQWAFSRGLPNVIYHVVPPQAAKAEFDFYDITQGKNRHRKMVFQPADQVRYIVEGEKEPVALDDKALTHAIRPEFDGTVAMIARYALPLLRPHWKEAVPLKPLSAFTGWAVAQDENALEGAHQVQFWYNSRVFRVNWTDPKEILAFKLALNDRVSEWLQDGHLDRWQAANALWIVAHSARSEDATAGSVFLAFPEECERIVAEKPGTKAQPVQEIILTGLAYQLPGFVSGALENVEVREVATVKAAKRPGEREMSLARRVVVGKAKGQKAPSDRSLPQDLLAFVAKNCQQPELGVYRKIEIRQIGEGSWKARLTP